MDYLLKFLIYNIDTLNGIRGSSIKLQNLLMKESKTNMQSRIKNQIMMKVHKKYMILRIRYKISFIAFIKRKTVVELILYQVKKSHKALSNGGHIPFYDPDLLKKIGLFEKVLKGDVVTGF